MLDVIRRYGLDRWGPLTCALLLVVAVITITVAVLIIVTRPSVDEVIKAAQALGLAAVALGATIAGHGSLRGHREVAQATRDAAAIAAHAGAPVSITQTIAGAGGPAEELPDPPPLNVRPIVPHGEPS